MLIQREYRHQLIMENILKQMRLDLLGICNIFIMRKN